MTDAIQRSTGKTKTTAGTVKKLGLVAATRSLVTGYVISSGIFLSILG